MSLKASYLSFVKFKAFKGSVHTFLPQNRPELLVINGWGQTPQRISGGISCIFTIQKGIYHIYILYIYICNIMFSINATVRYKIGSPFPTLQALRHHAKHCLPAKHFRTRKQKLQASCETKFTTASCFQGR